VSCLKLLISLELNILRNIWDYESTQNKIYNIVLVFFRYFDRKILHGVPLTVWVFFFFIQLSVFGHIVRSHLDVALIVVTDNLMIWAVG